MPTKKRIAFVANTSWGIYKFRLYLIKKLIAGGYSVFVLAPRDRYTDEFSELPGLTYIELIKFRSKSISPFYDLQLYKELRHHYRTIRPHLIFHYTIKANIFGSLAASRVGCPTVSVITGLGYAFSQNKLLQKVAKILYRRSLQKNEEVWFLNRDDQAIFVDAGLIRKDKTFVLPGEGVDAEAFTPAPYTPRDGEVTFLLIARMIRHKGILEFVRAAEILKSRGLRAQFQLLGFFDEGNPVALSRQQVEEWAKEKKIDYLGSTDHVAPFIEQADCVVLPSYREGMPFSLLEGASMCKALIATDTAGCRDLIADGVNGYLCKVKDGEDLAEKMGRYVQLSAADKRQMGVEGRALITGQYTKEIVTGIYLDKLNTLLT